MTSLKSSRYCVCVRAHARMHTRPLIYNRKKVRTYTYKHMIYINVLLDQRKVNNPSLLGLNSHPMSSGSASLWFLCTKQVNCYVLFFLSVTEEEYGLFRIIRNLMFVPMGLLLVAIVTGYVRHFVLKTWLHQTLQWVLSSLIAVLSFLAGRHFSRVRV